MPNANDVIRVGCDHGGYELKQHVLKFLESRSLAFHDVGCHSAGIVLPLLRRPGSRSIFRGEASAAY
jgi:ribose 5-phosphate isomerase B